MALNHLTFWIIRFSLSSLLLLSAALFALPSSARSDALSPLLHSLLSAVPSSAGSSSLSLLGHLPLAAALSLSLSVLPLAFFREQQWSLCELLASDFVQSSRLISTS